MARLRRCLLAAGIAVFLAPVAARGLALVYVAPTPLGVALGETFQLELRADLSQLVLGWGLDLSFDASVIAQLGTPVIAAGWTPVFAPDGDGLAAVAPPDGISGSNVLLATLTFEAVGLGSTAVTPSVTPGSLVEGFPLKPTGFDAVAFQAGVVNVAEPASSALLLAALSVLGAVRSRRPGPA